MDKKVHAVIPEDWSHIPNKLEVEKLLEKASARMEEQLNKQGYITDHDVANILHEILGFSNVKLNPPEIFTTLNTDTTQ